MLQIAHRARRVSHRPVAPSRATLKINLSRWLDFYSGSPHALPMLATNTATAIPVSLTAALDRFWDHNGGQHPHYVVAQMKGLHRAERKRKLGWRM